jgi:hypothetical protein
MLFSTFAAPPSRRFSCVTLTTGTGASGEILETVPQMKWSMIMSPITRILAFAKALTARRTRVESVLVK